MGPRGFPVESAPGAWSSELHSRLSLYLICPIPPARWKSALSTANPGSWNKGKMASVVVRASLRRGRLAGWWGAGNRCQCLGHYLQVLLICLSYRFFI